LETDECGTQHEEIGPCFIKSKETDDRTTANSNSTTDLKDDVLEATTDVANSIITNLYRPNMTTMTSEMPYTITINNEVPAAREEMYVGIVIGLVFAMLCAALGAVLIFRGKDKKQSDGELASEKYAETYDMQRTESSIDARNNMTMKRHDKDTENMLIQNPYYEGSDEASGLLAKSIIPDLNDTKIITKTQNVYYQM